MFLRFFFTLSIFLPTLAVYAHEFSHHEHEECEETAVHFHQKEESCFLDDFVCNNPLFIPSNETKYFGHIDLSEISSYDTLYNNSDLRFRFLRGPPSL